VSVASHLERRGAVYYWRRRLPHSVARRLGLRFLVISLRTREHISARYIAAQLDAVFEQMTMSGPDIWVSGEQLQALFVKSFRIHQEVIRRTHSSSKAAQEGPYDPDGLLGRAEHWAYRLIDEQGLHAKIFPADAAAMRQDGLSDASIADVGELLKWYTSPKQAAHMRFSAARLLADIGVAPTDDNVDRALSTFARAKSQAALHTKPHREAEFDTASLVAKAMSETGSIAWKPSTLQPAQASIPVIMQTPTGEIGPPVDQMIAWPSQPVVTLPAPGRPAALPWIEFSIAATGDKLVSDRSDDKTWDEKTLRQARMIIDLFGRFLEEERKITDMAKLSAADLDAFDGFLRKMGKNYGKSADDKTRSIDELRKRWAELPASGCGLEVKTRNKHYFF